MSFSLITMVGFVAVIALVASLVVFAIHRK